MKGDILIKAELELSELSMIGCCTHLADILVDLSKERRAEEGGSTSAARGCVLGATASAPSAAAAACIQHFG